MPVADKSACCVLTLAVAVRAFVSSAVVLCEPQIFFQMVQRPRMPSERQLGAAPYEGKQNDCLDRQRAVARAVHVGVAPPCYTFHCRPFFLFGVYQGLSLSHPSSLNTRP